MEYPSTLAVWRARVGLLPWEAGSGGSATPDSRAPLSGLGAGLGDCPGPKLRSGGLRGEQAKAGEVCSQEPGMGLEHWAPRQNAGASTCLWSLTANFRYKQQLSRIYPKGTPRGLVQLHAPALLERGLPARCTQLPDPG